MTDTKQETGPALPAGTGRELARIEGIQYPTGTRVQAHAPDASTSIASRSIKRLTSLDHYTILLGIILGVLLTVVVLGVLGYQSIMEALAR
jgi:hypothetical protein